MAVGVAVVIVLAIAYRTPILDHVVAWRFQQRGYRVLEQRFPRRAYVVIRDRVAVSAEDSPTMETLLVPFGDPER